MIIDKGQIGDVPALGMLWKQAFGDPEEFWQIFLEKADPINHCRLVRKEESVAAALYWFDCSWQGKKIAYLYGVATLGQYRGQGLCRALMESTHAYLKSLGYAGCILKPGGPALFAMYEKLGYTACTQIREFTCEAGEPIQLRQLTKEEYGRLRRQYLPEGGVIQEGETLAFLGALSRFYAGESCLVVCVPDGEALTVSELLGDASAAAGIVAALGYPRGNVRVPGEGTPFTMYRSLDGDPKMPTYFGLAMD